MSIQNSVYIAFKLISRVSWLKRDRRMQIYIMCVTLRSSVDDNLCPRSYWLLLLLLRSRKLIDDNYIAIMSRLFSISSLFYKLVSKQRDVHFAIYFYTNYPVFYEQLCVLYVHLFSFLYYTYIYFSSVRLLYFFTF